jgi:3-oxoacyl-[acyl-carrier-protein] synthase II
MQSLTPLWLLKFLPNMLPCHVAIIHDIQGPSNTITCGEAGAYLAVSEAAEIIQRNDADAALAGGGDSRTNPLGILRQTLMKRINCSSNENPSAACRPFDQKASGTILSEAAGVLVLEEMQSARSRGAKLLAEIAGWGSSHNLNPNFLHLTPDGKSVRLAIEMAMEQAGITPDKIDLIIPCGSGIAADDLAEAAGIQSALGKAVDSIPVWPIKSMLGHSVAAAGALDLIAAVKAIETQTIGKAINFDTPLDGCFLQLAKQPVQKKFRYVLCCGYSFGGQTAAILLKAIED